MAFTAQNMLGSRVLVEGTDKLGNTGRTTVDSTQWDELKQRKDVDASIEAFDAAVQDFFAPLVAAAEAAEQVSQPAHDPLAYVVFTEAVEGTPSQPAEIVELTRDSIVLRCIEENQTDRLIWVSDTELGVLSA